MGASAGLKLEFQGKDVGARSLLTALLKAGWTADDQGKISFLPLGDRDDYDWQTAALEDLNRVLEIIEEKHRRREVAGLILTWKDTCTGGYFLVPHPGELVIGWGINRRLLVEDHFILDVSWYLERLIPNLVDSDRKLVRLQWTEDA